MVDHPVPQGASISRPPHVVYMINLWAKILNMPSRSTTPSPEQLTMELSEQSAVSKLIADAGLKDSSTALPLEIIHNLRHQHHWTDLRLHRVSTSQNPAIVDFDSAQAVLTLPSRHDATVLISGLPPRHMYVHPDLLNQLVQHNIQEDAIPVQREWIVPMSIGGTWSLKRFCAMFDCLPPRPPVVGGPHVKHQDSKRVFLAMLAHNGVGGDGTVVYYIMQEGEVKPRQN